MRWRLCVGELYIHGAFLAGRARQLFEKPLPVSHEIVDRALPAVYHRRVL